MSKGAGGLLSRLICWASGSPASHAWLVYYDPIFETHMVLEAHETGFRAIPLVAFAKNSRVLRIVQPMLPIDAGMTAAGMMLGQGYDFAGLFGMVVVELGRRFKRRWRNPFRSRRSQFCTEAVARVLHAVKYGGIGRDPEIVDPALLWALFDGDGSADIIRVNKQKARVRARKRKD